MNLIEHGDQKVTKTTFNTLQDIAEFLKNAGAKDNEVAAFGQILCGASIATACEANGMGILGDDGKPETQANLVNRSRGRFFTLMYNGFKHITQNIADKLEAEANKDKIAKNKASQAEKLAAWEANDRKGRAPGVGNRPKHEIALEKAHGDARRQARENLGIGAQGRIAPDQQEAYVAEFRNTYTAILTNLSQKFEKITSDPEKIEKMVNKAVKELAVAPAAQKTKVKKAKAVVPAVEAGIEEPETVTAD